MTPTTAENGECNDPSCVSCWQNSVNRQIRLRVLASNLAVAGALCEAFNDGSAWGRWCRGSGYDAPPWQPGCGSDGTGVKGHS